MRLNKSTTALIGLGLIGSSLVIYIILMSSILQQIKPSDTGYSLVRFLLYVILIVGGTAGLIVQIRLMQRIYRRDGPKQKTRFPPVLSQNGLSGADVRTPTADQLREPVGVPLERNSFGRYHIQRQLGAGGMAIVYLALDPSFNRYVAIKVLPTHLCANTVSRERFRREARAIASLEHAAAVPVYDFGEESGQPYIVMRFLPGGSLQDRLQGAPLPLSTSREILHRITPALAKAHSMGMIHRDIKPGNILFDGEENPFLGDFGLVKLLESEDSITKGDFFGTPTYSSPEQCRGDQQIDSRTDIYSLTAMFFRMSTGFVPYAGNFMAVMSKHVSAPVPRLDEYCANLPLGLQAVIDRGMAKEPAERYPTVGDWMEALDEALPREDLAGGG